MADYIKITDLDKAEEASETDLLVTVQEGLTKQVEIKSIKAGKASEADSAIQATNATTADKAANADLTWTQDTENGDYIQIGSGKGCNIVNSKNADYADKAGKDADGNLISSTYIKAEEKGAANGVATLVAGRIPYTQLPESAMEYLGNWDASTNTPELTDGSGSTGDFYIVETGGTWNEITFYENDRIIYDGTKNKWRRLQAGTVYTVNNKSGNVELNAGNIPMSSQDTTLISQEFAKYLKKDEAKGESWNYVYDARDAVPDEGAINFTRLIAIDWDSIDWVSDGGEYYQLYKVSGACGASGVNIQYNSTLGKNCIYITFNTAVSKCSLGNDCVIQGASIFVPLDIISEEQMTFTVSFEGLTSVSVDYECTIYYVNGSHSSYSTGEKSWKWPGGKEGSWLLVTLSGNPRRQYAIGKNTWYREDDLISSWHLIAEEDSCPYPVGAVYTQYPQQKSPLDLWPATTWEAIDYGGSFFRASGGNATAFIGEDETLTQQTAQLPNIKCTTGINTHTVLGQQTMGAMSTSLISSSQATTEYTTYKSNYYGRITFNANGSNATYVDNGEVRPNNYTIQIWKRTV